MRIEDLKKFITSKSEELYTFAFVLTPDDLQASQLMIDAVSAFILKKNYLAANQELILYLYKEIFELSRIRYQQLKMSFKEVEGNSDFYSLDIEEKAALFLKEIVGLNLKEINFVLSRDNFELITYLVTARSKLTSLEAVKTI